MSRPLDLDESAVVRPEGVPEGAIRRVLRVPPDAAGQRLDVFVQAQLRRTSRTRAQRIVEKSAFDATGKRLRSSDRVRVGALILLWREPFEPDEEQPPLPILYEDPHLLVVDKPPLVAVHPTARYHKHTVIARLREARPNEFLTLVHRLDRETSGILLVARTPEADRAFKRVLEDRTLGRGQPQPLEKTYLTITHGIPPEGDIELPLELDAENPLRVKMRVAAPGTGLDARTGVSVLEAGNAYALVRCALHTGRQHQIRAHLSALGCPVVGDKLYGPDERMLARAADGELTEADLELLELPRHALHAHRYALRHPVTFEPLELSCPLPADLAEFWRFAKTEGAAAATAGP
ncbi:MAG TPA: RluA family pseudouridine synthase [Polyangiaceae bacterium]|jgi:23S rRNA pseudouridine1911/1915/1917 synthase|nr:RluA family pseudouridine synthase [Polyangiaceae bacterium]